MKSVPDASGAASTGEAENVDKPDAVQLAEQWMGLSRAAASNAVESQTWGMQKEGTPLPGGR